MVFDLMNINIYYFFIIIQNKIYFLIRNPNSLAFLNKKLEYEA